VEKIENHGYLHQFQGVLKCLSAALILSFWFSVPVAFGVMSSSIQELKFEVQLLPIDKLSKQPQQEQQFVIRGVYPKSSWRLNCNGVSIVPKDKGNFSFKAKTKGDSFKLKFIAVSPLGETQSQTFILRTSRKLASTDQPRDERKFTFSVQTGLAINWYSETDQSDFSQVGLVIKGSGSYKLTDRFDLGINAYYTALPLSSNTSDQMRFLGLNARLGYTPTWLATPWKLKFTGAWYYTTTFVTNDNFGFKNMWGPVFSPVLIRQLNGNRMWSTYLRFSLVSGGIGNLSASNEVALGGSYSWPFKGFQSFFVSADIAQLSIVFPDETTAQSRTISMGFGYSW
jgi:hypothetical protein